MTGSNQWMDRSLCLNCGMLFGQDTRWNIERKAARASRAMRPVSVASSLANPFSGRADETAGGNEPTGISSDDFAGVIEFEG